ncbi:unnamed protein product, partial [Prorocentrum cordatum]
GAPARRPRAASPPLTKGMRGGAPPLPGAHLGSSGSIDSIPGSPAASPLFSSWSLPPLRVFSLGAVDPAATGARMPRCSPPSTFISGCTRAAFQVQTRPYKVATSVRCDDRTISGSF